ncbi:pyroglutamyl-peptidase 1-like protein isoform X2 [Brachyhypopomus gauderio]|uniref:pyroglutamyl-peptidase 1-like protein isoform X2 n=1 Tax=Brachyhypopomus gauderio TaxID=698409 RepID=UPI0040413FFA
MTWSWLQVAVHLGIAPGSKCIILEQTAKNHGYRDRDVCGFCPAGNSCIEGGAKQLDSIISMRSLTKHLKGQGMDVIYSRDAGRYLCDFVYYCSLYYGLNRAVLIHVPASGCLAHPDRLVPQLQAIVLVLLQQLDKHSSPPTTSTRSAGQQQCEQKNVLEDLRLQKSGSSSKHLSALTKT